MIELHDTHVHLLAGLDDGPKTMEDAIEMCRIAYEDGTRWMAAGAHQNNHYPDVTPHVIREATEELRKHLKRLGIGIAIVPNAEVMAAHFDMEEDWVKGRLLSMNDMKKYLLVEMPDGIFVKLNETVEMYKEKYGLRVLLAHPERQAEILHGDKVIEGLIECGALVQVSAESVTNPKSKQDARVLRDWFRRGVVHVMGSDGHSPRRRLPQMGEAYHVVSRWAGQKAADRIFFTNGMKIFQGSPIKDSKPQASSKAWFTRLFPSRR